MDASTLLAPIFGFLPGDDERAHSSVLAIADELTENGYVLRYRTDETDDGLSGKEGTFLICSFWLVSALAIVGEQARARDLMERLLRIASPLGLYAEEFDVETGYHLGNFPQAFSHLALIEAAGRIIAADCATSSPESDREPGRSEAPFRRRNRNRQQDPLADRGSRRGLRDQRRSVAAHIDHCWLAEFGDTASQHGGGSSDDCNQRTAAW